MNIKIKVGVFYPDLFLYTLKISFIPSSVSWASIACSYIPNLLFDFHEWYSMKIKEQTRKRAAGCTWVRQGEADVVWIWFSKSIRENPVTLSIIKRIIPRFITTWHYAFLLLWRFYASLIDWSIATWPHTKSRLHFHQQSEAHWVEWLLPWFVWQVF